MRPSFANQNAPVLAGVIKERAVWDAIAAIRNCEYHGATGIDLHLSCLEPQYQNTESLQKIIKASSLPILALHYSQTYDRQSFRIDEEERVALLMAAIEAGASGIDMQGYTFDYESKHHFKAEYAPTDCGFAHLNPKEVVFDSTVIDRQMALIERIHAMGAEVLLSVHPDVVMNTEQVVELALLLEKRNPDIIKIVTRCNTEEELAESFRTMVTLKKELRAKVLFHCNGKMGRLSRIVNPLLGGQILFCCDGYTPSSIMEMPDLQTARSIVDNIRKTL